MEDVLSVGVDTTIAYIVVFFSDFSFNEIVVITISLFFSLVVGRSVGRSGQLPPEKPKDTRSQGPFDPLSYCVSQLLKVLQL